MAAMTLYLYSTVTRKVLQDWDLLELEHGCIVDRNACIFCHVGIFRNGTFIIDQVPQPARHMPTLLSALCTLCCLSSNRQA